jgi:hypothetical protein
MSIKSKTFNAKKGTANVVEQKEIVARPGLVIIMHFLLTTE